MIPIRFQLEAYGSKPGLLDIFTVWAHVTLESREVKINACTVERGGSTIPPHTIEIAALAEVFRLDEVREVALHEATLHEAACHHCGRAEALLPGICCASCRAVHSELPPCQAEALAVEVLAGLRKLAEEPVLKDEVTPLVDAAVAVLEHLAVLANRAAKQEGRAA